MFIFHATCYGWISKHHADGSYYTDAVTKVFGEYTDGTKNVSNGSVDK